MSSPLNDLRDIQLSSVEFVQDYLQLHFETALLTLYVWPDVADADAISVAFGEPGYRDALCSVIGETVSEAALDEGSSLTVEFENGTVIALSLREEDRDVDEAGSFLSAPGEALIVF